MSTDDATAGDIRFAAMNLLAMREHSVGELRRKLSQRFADNQLIGQAIATLTAENLQSDDRFTEAFVNMRKRQGKGPVRVALELKEKGVNESLIHRYVDASEAEWFDSALAEKQKRFGDAPPQNMKEKARQMRFLQYRGFTQPQILAAINAVS